MTQGFTHIYRLHRARMMNSYVDHEILRAARALDIHRSLGDSAREGRSRAANDKDGQTNSTVRGIIVRRCDTKPQNRLYANWDGCRKALSAQ
jgi:hypothetical protein